MPDIKQIQSENEVTAEWALSMRESLKLTQEKFWAPARISKGTGSNYENGRPIPDTVKRLMFMQYVIGYPMDEDPVDQIAGARIAEAGAKMNGTLRAMLRLVAKLRKQIEALIDIIGGA